MEKYFIGDSCLCWSIGDSVDKNLSLRVLSAYHICKNMFMNECGVFDFVPSYNALAMHFDPLECDIIRLETEIDNLFNEILKKDNDQFAITGKQIILPVIYDGEDLSMLSKLHGLSVRKIIDIHKGTKYTVAMIGFKPHFPFLAGLDKRIETPRLKTPRLKVNKGSVAIGGEQTGIYPEDSPGGWNLIGRTIPELLKEIVPGDIIEFKEVKNL